MPAPNIERIRWELLRGRESRLTDEQLVEIYGIDRTGDEIYRGLKDELEASHFAEFISINVRTGEYVIGETELSSMQAFRTKFDDAPSWSTQIGS